MSTKRKRNAISKVIRQLNSLKRTEDYESSDCIARAIDELKDANKALRAFDRGEDLGFFL